MAEKDWLEGCVPWSGKEEELPAGILLPPGRKLDVTRLIKSWTVLQEDGDVKEGVKKPNDSDIILGAEPNKEAIRAILKTYGENGIRIIDAYGRHLKPAAWVRRYKTNPFVVLAIMRKSRG